MTRKVISDKKIKKILWYCDNKYKYILIIKNIIGKLYSDTFSENFMKKYRTKIVNDSKIKSTKLIDRYIKKMRIQSKHKKYVKKCLTYLINFLLCNIINTLYSRVSKSKKKINLDSFYLLKYKFTESMNLLLDPGEQTPDRIKYIQMRDIKKFLKQDSNFKTSVINFQKNYRYYKWLKN